MKCLILAKLKIASEKHNAGVWFLVDKPEEQQTIDALGEKFIFSFDLDETKDEPFLKSI